MSLQVPLYGFGSGGGGESLNFKIIGNPMPNTANENTIWVGTDQINNYHFSGTEPKDAAEYDVWILTDTAGEVEFNAIMGNSIEIRPRSAKQYLNGTWVVKPSKIYQAGKWDYLGRYLYRNGAKKVSFVDGRVGGSSGHSWGASSLNFKVDVPGDSGGASQYVYTEDVQETSKKSKIKVAYTDAYGEIYYAGNGYLVVGLSAADVPIVSELGTLSIDVESNRIPLDSTKKNGILEVDIAWVDDDFKIIVGVSNYTEVSSKEWHSYATITDIWLE